MGSKVYGVPNSALIRNLTRCISFCRSKSSPYFYSFPRSGSTLVTLILAARLFPGHSVDLQSGPLLIPRLHRPGITPVSPELGRPIFSTHDSLALTSKRFRGPDFVIVRSPRETIASAFRYFFGEFPGPTAIGGNRVSLAVTDLLEAWSASFLQVKRQSELGVPVIFYEDLVQSPVKAFGEIFGCLGLQTEKGELVQWVRLFSRKNLSSQEGDIGLSKSKLTPSGLPHVNPFPSQLPEFLSSKLMLRAEASYLELREES